MLLVIRVTGVWANSMMTLYDEKSLAPSIYRGNLKVPEDG